MKILKDWLILILFLLIAYNVGFLISEHTYEQQITDLKSELKTKQKRIDGLHEQVSRQTKRIAELTGNGG